MRIYSQIVDGFSQLLANQRLAVGGFPEQSVIGCIFAGMELKEKLLARRTALKLSPQKVASMSGIKSGNTVVSYETGTPPKVDVLVRLAITLRTTVAYLVGEVDDPDWRPADSLASAADIMNANKARPAIHLRSERELSDDEIENLQRELELVRREQDILKALAKANSKRSKSND